MKKDAWLKLPKELQDFIWDNITDINEELQTKYNFSFSQMDFINTLQDKVMLKMISPLDIVRELENLPEVKDFKLRDIALDLAIKVFSPIREYIDDVDRLVMRLGGKVPKKESLRKVLSTSNEFVDYAEGNIKELLAKYKNLAEFRISSNKIINKEGRKVSPNIENWLKDYVHILGAAHHTSLQRAMYLSKEENALELSPEERKNLRFLLISYDDDTKYSFEKVNGIIKISEIKKITQSIEPEKKRSIDTFLSELKNNIKDLKKNLIDEEYLLAETDNDLKKIKDLLWNSIGLSDKEKAVSCIRLMINKKSFDKLVKEDTRFASILKRFLSIRYGQKMDNFVDKNIDKLLTRRLFLEMLLSEKLKFKDQETELIAFYLTNLVPDSGQIIYLDKSDFKLKWRDIQLVGENITWLDELK